MKYIVDYCSKERVLKKYIKEFECIHKIVVHIINSPLMCFDNLNFSKLKYYLDKGVFRVSDGLIEDTDIKIATEQKFTEEKMWELLKAGKQFYILPYKSSQLIMDITKTRIGSIRDKLNVERVSSRESIILM